MSEPTSPPLQSTPGIRKRQSARKPRGEDWVPNLFFVKHAQTKEYRKEWQKYNNNNSKIASMARDKVRGNKNSSSLENKRKKPSSYQVKKVTSSKKSKKNSESYSDTNATSKKTQKSKKDEEEELEEEEEEVNEAEVSDNERSTGSNEDAETEEDKSNSEEDGEQDDEKDVANIEKENENKSFRTIKEPNAETSTMNNENNEDLENDDGVNSGCSIGSDENESENLDTEKQKDSSKMKFYKRLQRSEKYGALNVAELAKLSGHVRHHLFRKIKFVEDSTVNKFVDEFCCSIGIEAPDEIRSKRKSMSKLIKDTFNARRGYATQQIVEKMRGTYCKTVKLVVSNLS
jgi:hypothetical protein